MITGWRGYLAVGVVCFAAGWLANGWRLGLEIAAMQRAIQDAQLEAANARYETAQRLNELEVAHNEIERLEREKERAFAAGVERGRIGLRVNVVPGRTEGQNAGVGEAGTAELAPAVRPDYYALREGLIQQYLDLKRCYETVRGLTAD